LQIRSPYLMQGYLDEPALTEATYQDSWFKTGDIAREVGGDTGAPMVELMGRHKEVISRGGNKVTPVEIEQAVCAHADVAAAMAVGVADAVLGERIHVLVVPRGGVLLDVATLRRHLEPRLERYKHPDAYYVADALPLGRTGKADRGQFKALITAGDMTPIER
jgi:long-chain acyl-CoA synthetase